MKDTTTSVQPLIDYFEKMISLNKAEKELIEKKFQSHLYLKRQFALQQGDVCEYFNFVVRGCLRLYKVDASGALHVLEFASENYWIVDLHSFHTKTPAAFNWLSSITSSVPAPQGLYRSTSWRRSPSTTATTCGRKC